MAAAALDVAEVIGDRLLIRRELAEEKKDRDADHHDAEGEDDELEEDGARRLAWNVVQRPVPLTMKSGRYPLSCVGASGTTIASLSQTDSQRRQATHFGLST